ncbi:hypothetical protein [Phaeobacter gallaeciensis]|uniref:Uncharacterized protein n=1 Tax=Phaeobacter gallaeciensis TaxID=60890 RepID=A0AAC9Z9W1_9RHOB|nr:hypothetical protein [Phaeobacter gallaeciensis]AHD10001.1 hypothetical protein Gal_02254 [Phaeobacter gallaeciensis DSM 26640]ATE93265.1 hypothetical protein PhaeoP11_02245 [Phaeobacter gallaeciensis]ATE96914.1 hypothetical protein PhaeoP73_01602 [Phaeobacter gallaeciensis]ATF01929.1 hypothetical protein PhaeoP75_02294 [Phaeobacter gallaeciensis]ATF06309.1 hypothetical protein PhaeoP63_02243 [Phaeobacter gallaeciensis]
MAQLDTRLPLMAQQPDIVNALSQSAMAAQQTHQARKQANQVQSQNALRNLFQTQGADIAAGQPQALNALAQLDPMQAVQMQSAQQNMQSRAQMMEQRRIAMGREAEAYAASLGAQERAAEAARVEQGIAQGMQFYQRGDLDGLNQLLGTVGEEPLQSLDEFPTVAAMYGDVLDKLKAVQELNAPPKPMSGPGKVQADIAAGLLPEGTPLSNSPQTTVNVSSGSQNPVPGLSKLGEGFTYLYNPDGTIKLDDQGRPMAAPVAGGPKDTSIQEAAQQSAKDTATDIVLNAATLAREAASNQDFGPAGTRIAALAPWTDSAEVIRQTDTLKSLAAAENLNAMRRQSKTGGALGNVTEKELKLLQDMSGALDPTSPNFQRDLENYEQTLLRVIHGKSAGDKIYEQSRAAPATDDELFRKYGLE